MRLRPRGFCKSRSAFTTSDVYCGEGMWLIDFLCCCRKDRLKKNPVVSNNELNQISGGLGDEAAKEFGKGGLGKGIGKAFD